MIKKIVEGTGALPAACNPAVRTVPAVCNPAVRTAPAMCNPAVDPPGARPQRPGTGLPASKAGTATAPGNTWSGYLTRPGPPRSKAGPTTGVPGAIRLSAPGGTMRSTAAMPST